MLGNDDAWGDDDDDAEKLDLSVLGPLGNRSSPSWMYEREERLYEGLVEIEAAVYISSTIPPSFHPQDILSGFTFKRVRHTAFLCYLHDNLVCQTDLDNIDSTSISQNRKISKYTADRLFIPARCHKRAELRGNTNYICKKKSLANPHLQKLTQASEGYSFSH